MKIKHSQLLLLACMLLAAFPVHSQSVQQQASPARFGSTRLTSDGRTDMAAVSPDGKRVAYIRRELPGFEVRLIDLGTGRDDVLRAATAVEYWGIDFAPDDSGVYVAQAIPSYIDPAIPAGQRVKLLRIRLDDRRVETVLEKFEMNSSFDISPDGRTVAFVRRNPEGALLVVAPLDGGAERILARRTPGLTYPLWRPDGGAIVFTAVDATQSEIVEVSVTDGSERVIVKPEGLFGGTRMAWLPDGRSFLMSLNHAASQWRVSYPDGALQRLSPSTADSAPMVRYNYDGARKAPVIIATQSRAHVSLWLSGAEFTKSSVFATGVDIPWSYQHPRWLSADTLLFIQWDRGSTPKLVVSDLDGRQIRTAPLTIAAPQFLRVSGNGNRLVLRSAAGGRSYWSAGANGEQPVQLTSGPSDFGGHAVSADGTWLAYTTYASGRGAVWKTGASGGTATLLIAEEASNPAISPDGQWVAAYHRASSKDRWRIVIVPAEGGAPVSLGDLPLDGSFGVQWTADGEVSFNCRRGGVTNICVVPREGGAVRQITQFSDGQIASHDWSSTGRLLVVRELNARDIVTMTPLDSR